VLGPLPPPPHAVNAMLAAIKAPQKTIIAAGRVLFTCPFLAGTTSIPGVRLVSTIPSVPRMRFFGTGEWEFGRDSHQIFPAAAWRALSILNLLIVWRSWS
jgi:hypothetical protein